MNTLHESDIDAAIDQVLEKFPQSCGIHDLYPNQRRIIHQFFKGENIIYTGKNSKKFSMNPLRH